MDRRLAQFEEEQYTYNFYIFMFSLYTKTTVYVYPRLLLLFLCALALVDLRIRNTEMFYLTHVQAGTDARINHAECQTLRRHEGLTLSY